MVPGAEGKVVLQKETAGKGNRFCIFFGGVIHVCWKVVDVVFDHD